MAKQSVIVSVLADTKKFSRAFKNLSREIGLTKLGDGFKGLGRRVGNFIGSAVKGVGALAGVVAGLALHGGIKRALAIEDAEASLRGLGHSTKSIERIMDSALASVKGTSFGLGDAATIASTAVAAGIKPGKELTRTLKLTANTAALAKTDLTEMGSILNKVWTRQRVSTRELNQISERGIPIQTALAEHYGVSQAELEKMVSAGKVDAATFAAVLEGTVGNAADEMGKATRGMAANVMAALGRVGEAFVSKFLPTVRDAMGGAIEILDKVTPVVADLGAKFGQWILNTAVPAVKALGEWLTGTLWPAVKAAADVILGAFRTALDTIRGALKDAGANASTTGKSIGTTLVRAVKTAGTLIGRLVRTVGNIVAWVIKWRDVLTPIAVAVATVVASITVFNKVMAIARAVQLAFNVVAAANPLGLIVTAIAAVVAGLVYFFTQTETGKRAWAAFTDFLGAAWEKIKEWAGVLWDWLKTVFSWTPVGLIVTNWNKITAFFSGVKDKIVRFFQAAWDFLKRAFSWTPVGMIVTNWNKITAFFSGVKDKIVRFFQAAWDFIKKAWSYTPLGLIVTNWNKITDFLGSIPGKVRGFFSNAVNWLRRAGDQIITGLQKGITQVWQDVITWFRGLKDRVLGYLGDVGQWLYQAGRDILDGLRRGITSMVDNVKDTITDVGDNISGWFKDRLGIASPSKVFAGYGKNIVQGLVKGIRGDAGTVRKAATDLAKLAAAAFTRGDKTHGDRVTWMSGQAKALAGMRKELDKHNKALDKARDQLKALRQERAAMREQIASNIMGTVDLSSVIAKDDDGNTLKGKTKFSSVSGYIKTLKAKFKTFAQRLKSLGAKGFPAGLVQMIAGLGPDDGIEVAQALLSGSAAEIKELKADWTELEKWSDKAGKHVAAVTFDTAIAAQKGLVDGLTKDTAKIEKATKKLAKNLAKWIKKELGIKSPSRVFRAIGGDTLDGLRQGIEKSIPGVRKAMGKVSDAVATAPMHADYAGAALPKPAPRGETGNVYNITVSGVLDGTDAGRKIVAAIRDYERMNGLTR